MKQDYKLSNLIVRGFFLNLIISKLDEHVVLLLINYIAGQLSQIFQRVIDAKYYALEPVRLQLKQKHTTRSKKIYFYSVIQLILYK